MSIQTTIKRNRNVAVLQSHLHLRKLSVRQSYRKIPWRLLSWNSNLYVTLFQHVELELCVKT